MTDPVAQPEGDGQEPELIPGTPEYDAAMIARAEQTQGSSQESDDGAAEGDTGAEAEGETLLAGKYKTAEDLEKAYVELQKRFSSGERGDESSAPQDTDLPPRETADDAEGDTEGDTPSLDFEKYNRSIAENGSLTDADYEEIESTLKLPRSMIDAYVEGIKAQAQSRVSAVAEALGGEEQFEAVRKWASTELSDRDYESVNRQLQSAQSNEDVALIYQTLQTRMRQAQGSEPSLVAGQGSRAPAIAGFENRAELTQAMSDPKYASSPKYRAEVEKRIAATDWL